MKATETRRVNLMLIALLALVTSFTAWHEGYIPQVSVIFLLTLLGGLGVAVWLALNITTRRLVALILSIFVIEYIKESLGVRSGHFSYAQDSYLFGVWAWVLGGLVAYAVATLLLTKWFDRFRWSALRYIKPIIVVAAAVAGYLLMGDYRLMAGPVFWLFYAVLTVVAIIASTRMRFPLFGGLVVAAWVIGAPSEYAGSVASGVWTFTYDPSFPPLFLLLGCWPLEIIAQFVLSAALAREPINPEPVQHHSTPAGETPKPAKTYEVERIMVPLTKREKQLKIVMLISGFTYCFFGFAFAIVPGPIVRVLNSVSAYVLPSLPLTPVSVEKFWVALSFSMMMTITVLCFMAAHNVRKNKGYVFPVIISKAASALSALIFFLAHAYYLSYLFIVVLDGSLCIITLVFYLRANRAFFEAQTAYLREKPAELKNSGPTLVVSLKGDDMFQLLDEVLERSRFWEVLDERFRASGKAATDYRVVIKPNFMYMHSLKDYSTYTDPKLVEALVDRIVTRGFTNVTLVEAQSTYGNYYQNREVVKVAKYIGYSTDRNYRIVDLTEEMVPYDYGGRLGNHFVGPTWRDADFRVSFAKNKTHVFCHYTLTLKNIYGTLPMQNKLKEYHTKREYDWPTIETLKHFPVHFGLIDGFYSADGHFGVIVDPEPNLTKTIIGGENLLAVDWVGARKMGLNPDDPQIGRFLPLAQEAFGKPEITWVGDQSDYDPWQNVSEVFIKSLDIIEEAYAFSNFWFAGLTAMDKYFRFKWRAWPIRLVRIVLAPFKRLLYRYDKLT